MITELAFLRVFLSWELFLEETFILYLTGKTPPRGRAPHRFVYPPNRKGAVGIVSEGRDFAKWSTPSIVVARAERFFRDGKPFSPAMSHHMSALNEMRHLRNAIAHWQEKTQDKFEAVVRTRSRTGTYQKGLSVGAFLGSTVPTSNPPQSFFDDYVSKVRWLANKIVPN
jgi:hypothetical protein